MDGAGLQLPAEVAVRKCGPAPLVRGAGSAGVVMGVATPALTRREALARGTQMNQSETDDRALLAARWEREAQVRREDTARMVRRWDALVHGVVRD